LSNSRHSTPPPHPDKTTNKRKLAGKLYFLELERGTRDPQTNVTNNDMDLTGKIAWAHLKEFPDYYTRLDRLEAEADAYWSSRR